MADRRIGSDHTPMQVQIAALALVAISKETPGNPALSASPGPTAHPAGREPKGSSSPHMRINSIGGHCLPSDRTTEGSHISRRAGIPPTPAPPQIPSAHVSLGQGLPQIVREARLVDCQEQIFAARRHMRPAGLYVKREKPGFDWAFLRASTRQHSSPAPIGNQWEA